MFFPRWKTDKLMEFQKFLLQVEQSLSPADVQAHAFLCVDLVNKDLSYVSSAKELLSILMDKDLLSSEDTSLLTELLHISHRQDVIRQLGLRIVPQPMESFIGPYRKLLFSLSENITEEDLKNMKFLLRNTLPLSKLQDKMTTLQLLREMEKEDILSSQNLDTLNQILSSVCPHLTRRIDQFKRVNNQTTNQLSNQIINQETGAGKPLSRLVVGAASHEGISNQHLSRTASGDALMPPSYFSKEPRPTEESCIASAYEHPESLAAPTEGLENLTLTSSIDHNDVRSNHVSFSSVPENMNLKPDIPPSSTAVTAVELPRYDMKGEKRGVCLIINNHDFSKSSVKKLGNRDGTKVDEIRLKEVFEWLGFELEIQQDCTQQQILSLLDDLGQRDHSQADCIVCCLLSHGKEGSVYGVDGGAVDLKQLTKPFSGLVCPSLKDKPKLFFIQACQGSKEQQVVFLESDSPLSSSLGTDAEVPENSIPADADVLFGMATLPDYAAFRDRKEGTWYIQSLCEKLQLLVPQGIDLLSILTEVNNHVSKRAFGGKKQMPQPVFSLRKKVIFPIPSSPGAHPVQ